MPRCVACRSRQTESPERYGSRSRGGPRSRRGERPDEQIDERLDLNQLVAPLEECYCPDLEHEKALRSMKLFADEVMPNLKQKAFPALQ